MARLISAPAVIPAAGQKPEFDEYMIVLRDELQVETRDGVHHVAAGQAIIVNRGKGVRYSAPGSDGAEYIAVCFPAFSLQKVH